MRDDEKCDDVRVEIYAYFTSCTGNIVTPRKREVTSKADSGDDPMDADFLLWSRATHKGKSRVKGKEDAKQSTNNSKGPSSPKFDGACHNCGCVDTTEAAVGAT